VQQVVTLQEEIKLHIDFCKEYGLEVHDIESQEEDQATTAYTRYVLDIGQSQDWLALQIALLPCLIGYGIIARRLYDDPSTVREGSKYWKWIEQYVGQEYIDAMVRGSDMIEEQVKKQVSLSISNRWRCSHPAVSLADQRACADFHPCNECECAPCRLGQRPAS
jgi:thiaminase